MCVFLFRLDDSVYCLHSILQFYTDLSTVYTKIQPGEAYVNMRGSEYLPMAEDPGSPPLAKLDPRSGKVEYLNEKVVRPSSLEEACEEDALMAGNKVIGTDGREDSNRNKAPSDYTHNKGNKSAKSNGLNKHRTNLQRSPNNDGSGDVSVKSATSSGFHSDYAQDNVTAPPHYSMVVDEMETSQL